MASTHDFSRLVSLACHDLRTPLATAQGFARTLLRLGALEEPAVRYVTMIDAASSQMARILDDLALAARVEGGRYEPFLVTVDTRALADAAVAQLEPGTAEARGEGDGVIVEVEATERALAALALAALRHGGLDRIEVVARGTAIEVSPLVESAAPVVRGVSLRDLGAAVAVLLVHALGGCVAAAGEAVSVQLAPA